MKKIVLMALLSLTVVSCTKDSDPNYFGTIKPKHPFDEVWMNNREEPQYMDPTLVHGVPDGHLAQNSFYRLVAIDPTTGKPVPELAERWDVLENGTKYVFHMRKGIKWSDGQPITANDVEYSWKRLMDPATAAEYQGLASNIIENGNAFAQKAIHLTGFEKKVSPEEVQSFAVKHDVAVSKIEKRRDSDDLFVFVKGTTGEETLENREKFLNLMKEQHPWGEKVVAQITGSDVVGVYALDAEKLEVKLVGPLPYFILLCEFANFAPLPKHVIEKFKADGKEDQWTKVENMVVSGPFKLKEEQFKQYKVYEKNPNYWDAASVRTKKIKILMLEKETASLNAYKVGEVDWIGPHEVPSEQLPNVKGFKDFHNDPYLGVYSYIINVKEKPLDDPKVRQALSYAIDRAKITEHVLGGGQIPYNGIVPDNLAGYKSYQGELFNLEKAKALLAEAGYPDGKGFPKLKFLYDTKEVHRLIVQAVQEMWKQNLNIDIEAVNVEWKVYLDRMEQKDYQIGRQGWIGDFLDPYTFMELEISTSGNNHTNWANEDYDKLIAQSNLEGDATKRFDLIRQAEKIAVETSGRIPIYIYTKSYMLKPYIKGFWPDFQDHHAWKHMWVDLDWKKTEK
jgi:oligopeptide transport system substrate-binding protein